MQVSDGQNEGEKCGVNFNYKSQVAERDRDRDRDRERERESSCGNSSNWWESEMRRVGGRGRRSVFVQERELRR